MHVTFQNDRRLTALAGAVPLLEYPFDRDCLTALRGELGRCGKAYGLDEQALFNFVLAANEITTNAARHAHGRGRLRLWFHDNALWCEVSDNGPGISRALLEESHQRRPGHLGGHGLWLARQIFASVDIETSRASGTRVLLCYPLPAPEPSRGMPMDMETRTPPPELRLDRFSRGGVTTITVAGDIDMTTGDRFRLTLTRALEEPTVTRLLVAVGALRFIDSNGITALIRAHRTAQERGIDFTITHADGAIRNVFEMLGVYEMLTTAHEQA